MLLVASASASAVSLTVAVGIGIATFLSAVGSGWGQRSLRVKLRMALGCSGL